MVKNAHHKFPQPKILNLQLYGTAKSSKSLYMRKTRPSIIITGIEVQSEIQTGSF